VASEREYISLGDAARMLGINEKLVRRLIHEGTLSAERRGRYYRISAAACRTLQRQYGSISESKKRAYQLFRSTPFVSTGQAANMLKVSLGTILNFIRSGTLQAFRPQSRSWYMIPRSSIYALIERWMAEANFLDSPGPGPDQRRTN